MPQRKHGPCWLTGITPTNLEMSPPVFGENTRQREMGRLRADRTRHGARMTQINNLLNLAPDIQEMLLFLPQVIKGDGPVTERRVRPVVRVAS